ncbi:MAG TPA: glycosyltransferase [Bryobacteraceae bacterium]|nr:glycosyltransferase [Bryobacteraceae bacterium]
MLAAYNAERHIAETLESIRSQIYGDLEVIVVDDGSTDCTAELVAKHPEIRYLRQPNRGQPAARNTGIRAALGDYIAFVDADDLWLPSKLEKQASYLARHPEAAWVYSDAIAFDSKTGRTICRVGGRIKLHEGSVLRPLLLGCFIPSPTPVIRRDVLEEAGLFDESDERRIGEDWNMWLRIAEKYPVAFINEPLALVRVHDENMTRTTNVHQAYECKRTIVEDAVTRNPELLGSVKPRAMAAIAVAAGLRLLRSGEASAARRMFASALMETPWNLRAYCYFGAACLPGALHRCATRLASWFRHRTSRTKWDCAALP